MSSEPQTESRPDPHQMTSLDGSVAQMLDIAADAVQDDVAITGARLAATPKDDGLAALRALSDAAAAEQAAEDKVRSRKGRFLPSFFDTTARWAFTVAAERYVRSLLATPAEGPEEER